MDNQYFYSNCLFEAIKAKLKNPKKTRILYIPARFNTSRCFHFMWTDGEKEYDFDRFGYIPKRLWVWHEGRIRTHRLGCYDRYIKEAKATNGNIVLTSKNEILHTLNED